MTAIKNAPVPKFGAPAMKKTKSKARGVGQPKRGRSAFLYFSSAKRRCYMDANPGTSMVDIARLLGVEWMASTDAEKAPYHASAATDKARYDREISAYTYVAPPVKKTKRRRDPNEPKRALNAYMFFFMSERTNAATNNPDHNVAAIGKLVGAKWNTMSSRARAPFNKKASKDKARYAAEMKAYRAAGDN